MKEYVIRIGKDGYVGKRAVDKDCSREFGYFARKLDTAARFKTLKDAHSVWTANKKSLKEIRKIDLKEMSIELLPSKGLPLEANEVEMYCGVDDPFDKDGHRYWEKYAVKEISAKEALNMLADFVPDPENYKDRLTLYFWDTYDDKNGYGIPHGGFYEGQFSSMYGYDHKGSTFITENLGGYYYHQDHAGSYRLVDSGYLLPVEKDGKIRWVTAGLMADWIKYDGGKIEDIKPAFETSLKLEDFIASVNKHLKQGY